MYSPFFQNFREKGLFLLSVRPWWKAGQAPPAAEEAPCFRGSAPVCGFRQKPQTGTARRRSAASSLLTKEKGHPKLDVLKQGSHHSAVNPAERFTAESEETSCRTKKPRRRRGFVSNRKFLSRSGQRGSNSLPGIPRTQGPRRSPAERFRWGEDEQRNERRFGSRQT